jgi:hypothetical protein
VLLALGAANAVLVVTPPPLKGIVNVEYATEVTGASLVVLAAAELGAEELDDVNVVLLKRTLLALAVVERTVSVWIVKMMVDSLVVEDAAAWRPTTSWAEVGQIARRQIARATKTVIEDGDRMFDLT